MRRQRTVGAPGAASVLAAVIAVVTVAGALGPAVAPAGAQGARAAQAAPAAPAGTVNLAGHGFGHGRGMGQWGAYGYALDGWDHGRILDHFYGGTTMGSVPATQAMTVRLVAQDARDLVVSSGAPFFVDALPVDPGRAVRLTRLADGRYQLFVATACGQPELADYAPIIADPVITSSVPALSATPATMLTICGGPTYRGSLRLTFAEEALRTVNTVGIEDYLRGVVPRESPASWPGAALRAQAVAARSYAMAENRYSYAKTCDTTTCQVYGGAALAGVVQEAAGTDAAVRDTAGQVRVHATGAVARTEFSSSTGGYSAGGTFPAVLDEGDDASPYHDWTASLPAADIAARYGIGTLVAIDVTRRNGLGDLGGRVLELTVRGTTASVVRTGDAFRLDFGLRSDWFAVTSITAPPPGSTPPPPPLGPHLDWFLRNTTAPGPPDVGFSYGGHDRALSCDWDGDGRDTPATYSGGAWFLRDDNSAGAPTTAFAYGASSYIPVCGDWDGNGTDTVGVFDGGAWFLRNSNTPGPPDLAFAFGVAGYRPVVGDWDGDGRDGVGVYVDGAWYLRHTASAGGVDRSFAYGIAAYRPVPGDWDGDGVDTPGVYVDGAWYLRNTNGGGPPDLAFAYGIAAYQPVPGDFDGNGTDTPGVAVTAG